MKNFNSHYFNEENLEEGPVGDVIGAGPGVAAKAVAKGVGRGIANVVRGALGKTKTMAFEPGWLKVLKPIDQKTYQKTVADYANWKNKQTKLGPKKNFSVKDIRDGVLGDFTGKNFVNILAKYDPSNTIEKDVNMDANVPPVITIYLLSNGGKVIFFQLPVGEDGKKKKYAMGLDNKAERAFRLIHGMTFQDYFISPDEEKKTEEPQQQKTNIKKIPIEKNDFVKLAPPSKVNKESFSLLDAFNEEVLREKALVIDDKKAVVKKNDKWYIMGTNKKIIPNAAPISQKNLAKYIAVNDQGEKDEELQKQLDTDAKGVTNDKELDKVEQQDSENTENKGTETTDNSSEQFGKLYSDFKEQLLSEPTVSKETAKAFPGWRYLLKNNGVIFLYQSKEDQKYYIAYTPKAEETVLKVIDKYGLEKSEEIPESYKHLNNLL